MRHLFKHNLRSENGLLFETPSGARGYSKSYVILSSSIPDDTITLQGP